MSIRIICINKAGGNHENEYTAITELGWINETTNESHTISREALHDWVKGGGVAYVKDIYGNKANLIAEVSPYGTKYVRTKPDGIKADNLLSLPECK